MIFKHLIEKIAHTDSQHNLGCRSQRVDFARPLPGGQVLASGRRCLDIQACRKLQLQRQQIFQIIKDNETHLCQFQILRQNAFNLYLRFEPAASAKLQRIRPRAPSSHYVQDVSTVGSLVQSQATFNSCVLLRCRDTIRVVGCRQSKAPSTHVQLNYPEVEIFDEYILSFP